MHFLCFVPEIINWQAIRSHEIVLLSGRQCTMTDDIFNLQVLIRITFNTKLHTLNSGKVIIFLEDNFAFGSTFTASGSSWENRLWQLWKDVKDNNNFYCIANNPTYSHKCSKTLQSKLNPHIQVYISSEYWKCTQE